MAVFEGSAGDDIYTGGGANDIIRGNGGNDQLSGGDGNDNLEGGAGADILNGGTGDDFLSSYIADSQFNQYPYMSSISLDDFADFDVLNGGDGDDTFAAGYGDTIIGGSGYNRLVISFLGATSGVTANFAAQASGGSITVGGGTISGINSITNLQGSNFDDDITSIGSYYGFGNFFGNGGNDRLIADYYTNNIYGGDGNDIVDGRPSQYLNLVDGGDGDDTLYVNTNGFGRANGGAGNDTIYAGGQVDAGSGDDTIFMEFSYYGGIVNGDDGNDVINGSSNANVIFGGTGGDIIRGGDGDDVLGSAAGASGLPIPDSGTEHDQLFGDAGNDSLSIGVGDDADGGTGTDTLTINFAGAGAAIVFDSAAIANSASSTIAGGGTISGIENLASISGSAFNDTFIIATALSLVVITGGSGNDTVTSNQSSVEFNGGEGDDRLISGAAGDTFNGGAGSDTIDYRNYAAGLTVRLGFTGPGGDQFFNVENIAGTAYNDTLEGDGGANRLEGGAGNDTLIGNGGADSLFAGSGTDVLLGGDGNDGLFFGAFFDAGDSVDGGAGLLDQLGLQGDYSAGVTLGANSVVGVEQVVLLPGSDTRFGAPGNQSFSYSLTTGDAAIGAGQQLVFQANTLRAGESFTLDAAGERDGLVFTYGGLGTDHITGSQTGDAFFFGAGRFNPGDVVDGQGGTDQIGLQGSYSGADAIVLGAGQIVGIEAIVLLTNSDTRFGGVGTTPYSYDLTTNDANVAAGQRLAIQANTLASNEVLRFNGAAETDGSFSIFSGNGNDRITGSQNDDTISGRSGADTLTGGGGNDIFLYTNVSDSTTALRDMITDFRSGDRIDLSRIDAIAGGSDDPFTLIGSAAFGNIAGQLRVSSVGGGIFAVDGDINGDGTADFSLYLTNADAHPLTATDFVL